MATVILFGLVSTTALNMVVVPLAYFRRSIPASDSPAFPHAGPEAVGLSSEELDQVGDEIVAWIANRDLVGAEVLVVKDHKTVFHGGLRRISSVLANAAGIGARPIM